MTQARHASLGIRGTGSQQVHRLRTWHRLRLMFIGALIILLIAGGITFLRHYFSAKALAAETKNNGLHYTTVTHAEPGGTGQTLSLPGTLLGQIESPIASRASGYVLRWTKDIGATVKKGELLAEISSPEAEQQLAQALSNRQQLVSVMNLAKLTAERWKSLLEQRAVSQQEYDERRSAYEQAAASLNAADANIQRLKDTLAFSHILAPFDGVITRRNVNVGDLIDAGGSNARPLFVLTQMSTLRAYVYVPQAYAGGVKVGQTVTLRQPELPGQKFEANVVRTARAIDPASRSLQVEVSIDNSSGRLLPGAYVDVTVPAGHHSVMVVPVNTLLLRGEGPRIAVIDEQGIVKLHAVELGKDFGPKVELLSGVTVADKLVLNPPDGLADGDQLIVIEKKEDDKGRADKPEKSQKDKNKS